MYGALRTGYEHPQWPVAALPCGERGAPWRATGVVEPPYDGLCLCPLLNGVTPRTNRNVVVAQ